MTRSIFLNAKINEIIKADKMKNEYQNIVNVKIEEIVTSINIIINNKEDK